MMVKFLLPLNHYVGFWAFGARPTPNQRHQRLIGTGQRLQPWKDRWSGAADQWMAQKFTKKIHGFSAMLPQFSIIYICIYVYM